MKLTNVKKISGCIELMTGLHIGGGDAGMHIGGTDNPVIKNPITQQPYIPGSSIKGKMRSLLEWELGVVGVTKGEPVKFEHLHKSEYLEKLSNEQKKGAEILLSLFGGAPDTKTPLDLLSRIGPTRLAFWDCGLQESWTKEMEGRNLLLTEVKMENTINRISGTADHPRNMERVPAGARFDFNVSMREHDNEDLVDTLLRGLKLLELTGLGGSGSRGYGKIKITLDDQKDSDIKQRFDNFTLGMAA